MNPILLSKWRKLLLPLAAITCVGALALCVATVASGATLWLLLCAFLLLACTFALLLFLRSMFQSIAGAGKPLAERNAETGLYERDAATRFIARYLLGDGASGVHGLIMLEAGEDADAYARRIASLFRKTDIITIDTGGFLIFLRDVGGRAQLARQAEELLQTVNEPMAPSSPAAQTCAGAALYPEDAAEYAALLQRAESALVRARTTGGCAFYDAMKDDVFSA